MDLTERDPVLDGRIIYDDSQGGWRGYSDKGAPTDTNPGAIYAGYANNDGQSAGDIWTTSATVSCQSN